MEDYYGILGVTREANASVLRMAYEGRLKLLASANLDETQRVAQERLLKQAYSKLLAAANTTLHEPSEPRLELRKVLLAIGVAVFMLGIAAAYFYFRLV